MIGIGSSPCLSASFQTRRLPSSLRKTAKHAFRVRGGVDVTVSQGLHEMHCNSVANPDRTMLMRSLGRSRPRCHSRGFSSLLWRSLAGSHQKREMDVFIAKMLPGSRDSHRRADSRIWRSHCSRQRAHSIFRLDGSREQSPTLSYSHPCSLAQALAQSPTSFFQRASLLSPSLFPGVSDMQKKEHSQSPFPCRSAPLSSLFLPASFVYLVPSPLFLVPAVSFFSF